MDNRKLILIVDDTPENLKVLGQMLEEQGYEVMVAGNGNDALVIAGIKPPPDLILLDIMMPGLDGYGVCRALKANPELKHIPVIFISAMGMLDQKIKAFSEGGVDYIVKPFQVDEVIARVKTHLQLIQIDELKREIIDRKKLEDEIVIIRDEERKRLGQELHDGLGQQLTGIAYRLKSLENKLVKNESPELDAVKYIIELNNTAIDEVRLLARGLYPLIDDLEGAADNIEEMAININKIFEVNCRLEKNIINNISDKNIATCLYSVAREAISNAIKHGKARNILISLNSTNAELDLTVEDDGSQVKNESSHDSGMGLRIMKYRSDLIDAEFEFIKNAGEGFIVHVKKRL